MATRRINSTGRAKILRDDARFRVAPDRDGILFFDCSLNLRDYGLPGDADVFVEAYRQTTFMRFFWGTVASPVESGQQQRRLTEFNSPEGLLFRVKVTSTGDRAGVLLAEGDKLPIAHPDGEPENRIPLLPTVPEDLEEEVWRIGFGTGGPQLLINNRIGDWKAVAASPVFRSLVFPAALRIVLWRIYFDQDRDDENTEGWEYRWLRFSEGLPGVAGRPEPDCGEEEWEDWVTSAAESFSRTHAMLEQFRSQTWELV